MKQNNNDKLGTSPYSKTYDNSITGPGKFPFLLTGIQGTLSSNANVGAIM